MSAAPARLPAAPRRRTRAVLAFAVAYLVAGAVETIVLFSLSPGHADVPFTTFPGYFVLVPITPLLVFGTLTPPLRAAEVVSAAVFLGVLGAAWFGLAKLEARAARGRGDSGQLGAREPRS